MLHAIAVHTAQGVVLHSGDYKIDLTPVDSRRTDLARIGQLAKDPGIRLLMADSTNAEEAGYSPSETSVGSVLTGLFAAHRDRRIVTASFASHLHRIQQIATAAMADGRKIATLGLEFTPELTEIADGLRFPEGADRDAGRFGGRGRDVRPPPDPHPS